MNVHDETQEQREARWAIAAARQTAYRSSLEAQAIRAERLAAGLCVTEQVEDLTQPWLRKCITHNCPDSMAHHFEMNPDAFND